MNRQLLIIFILSSCYAVGFANSASSNTMATESSHIVDLWEYQLSFSYPFDKRNEVAAGQTFTQVGGSSISWSAIHLILKHKLSVIAIRGVTPALIFDYEHATNKSTGGVFLSQLSLEHQRGDFSFMFAPLYEYGWSPDGPSSNCAGIDCSIFHAFTDRFCAGLESHWKAEIDRDDPSVDDLYIVPAASLISETLSYSLGLAVGLHDDSGEPIVRCGLSISF